MKYWIAKCWGLRLYEYKPELHVNGNYKCFLPSKGKVYEIDEDLFPEITFENSPQEVELKLVSEIVGVAESPLKTFPRVNEFEIGTSYRR